MRGKKGKDVLAIDLEQTKQIGKNQQIYRDID